MFKKTKLQYHAFGAAVTLGMMAAAEDAAASGNNFGNIASNITASISELPALVAALSYLFGILLAALGIMKIKDHVENPTQTPLKDGAIRLAVGGALFALPIITEAMFETIGEGDAASTASMNAVSFGTAGT